MAITVTMSQVDSSIIAGRPTAFQVNVANGSSSSVTLQSLTVSGGEEVVISQPNFLTPNVALGTGNPTIAAGATVSYVFDVVFMTPNTPGPSPSAPLGATGVFLGQPAGPTSPLVAAAVVSDGSAGQVSLQPTVLSQLAPFPPVSTGTLQLQFQPGFNAIGGLVLGLL